MNRRGNTVTKVRVLTLFLLPILWLWGCAEMQNAREDPIFDEWKARVETSQGYSPRGYREVQQAQERLLQASKQPRPVPTPGPEDGDAPEPVRPLPKDKMSMRMHDVDLPVLLRALAANANQNIMVNENVKGKSTINIHTAPWDQVFLGLLRTSGLAFRWEGDIIRIMTRQDFENDLKLLEADRKKREYHLQIRALKARAELTQPLVTRVVPVKYANPVALRDNLWAWLRARKAALGNAAEEDQDKAMPEFRGAIQVDLHTNSLVIQATEIDLAKLMDLLVQLDRPTMQVLIEAHIVETGKETARELGVQWGGLYHGTGDNYWITPGARSNGKLGGTVNDPVNPTSGQASNFPAEFLDGLTPATPGLTLGFLSQKLGEYLLDVQLSALENEGRLNILSSPSITTLDNVPARIESGKEVPFQTVVNDEVSIEWKKAVLSLDVTPHSIDGETLKLQIKVHKDELDFNNTVGVGGNPTIITKNAETNVVLFDGETTVIGGLNREINADAEDGIPWLRSIPFFGYLFKTEARESSMEEVLIFITPRILKERSAALNARYVEPRAPQAEE